jgi:hypothetical protein
MRTVVRDPRFEAEMQQIERNVEKADEFLRGAETILSRKPEAGHHLGGDSHVWFLSGYTVDLSLYYTFDDEKVYWLSIRKIPPIEI